MKIRYDPAVDALTILLRDGPIAESDEISPNVIADFDADGEVVGIEILAATRVVDDPANVTFDILTPASAVR